MPSEPWQAWAARLDQADNVRPTPHGKPQPRPPVDARPKRISVSRVETLIRDPYAIYADAVLKLRPLPNIAAAPDAALRGTLFHKAIGDFFTLYPKVLPEDAVEKFIALGEEIFRPFRNDPEIMGFWWTRFQRLARWIVENEVSLRSDVAEVIAEVKGSLPLKIGEADFTLSGRADRIDIFSDGRARIVDFKTGAIPSVKKIEEGFSPQLTLEAAMLELGAFEHVGKHETSDLTYIRITGGIPPGELKSVDLAAHGPWRVSILPASRGFWKNTRIPISPISRATPSKMSKRFATTTISRATANGSWRVTADGQIQERHA